MQLKLSEIGLALVGSSLTIGFVTAVSSGNQEILGQIESGFEHVTRALKNAGIIDDVIKSEDFIPKCFVVPSYGKKVELGNKFKQPMTKQQPSLNIHCPDMTSSKGLTIVLTDPDAPSRDNPKWSEFCHWIAKIPTSSQALEEYSLTGVSDVEELVEYKPPGPPEKTGFHRYVFLLLEGDNSNLTEPDDRQNWGTGKPGHGVKEWASREGLDIIGANFFIEKNKKQ